MKMHVFLNVPVDAKRSMNECAWQVPLRRRGGGEEVEKRH